MINGRQMSGEGQIWDDNSDFLGMNLGPMTDEDMFLDEDPFWDDAEMFDYPMMDNMGTTGRWHNGTRRILCKTGWK